VRELGIALRSLARRPGFALGVILTLGLGVGATTAVFTVVDGVMLRPLPYEEPGALVTIGSYAQAGGTPGLLDLGPITTQHYQNLRARATSFAALAVVDTERLLRPSAGLGERVPTHAVSAELLGMLGAATPAAGRAFLPEEYTLDRSVVMITYDGWQRRFGGDPAVIGRPLGEPDSPVLVGVLPPSFRPLEAFGGAGEAPDFYYAGGADRATPEQGWEPVWVLGRLRDGVALEQASAEVERLATELSAGSPELVGAAIEPGVRVGLNGLEAQTVGASGRELGLFFGAAVLLLVLATMNGATLLLVRALDRTQELSVRVALGAGRARVLRLLATEAAVLAALGGALGVLLAYGGVDAFLRYAPVSITRLGEVALDGRALAAAVVVSLGTGVAVGILPALQLTSRAPWARMQGGGRSVTEASRLRSVLVAGQMAVALVLLSGAGLLFNSFVRVRAVEPGFQPDGLITVSASFKGSPAVEGLGNGQAWDLLLERLAALPGVESVGGATTLPFETPFVRMSVAGIDERIAAYAVTPDYLPTMGTELIAGRGFEAMDAAGGEPVALVNESFVREAMRGADPIGRLVPLADAGGEVRIVGVVEDVVQRRAEEGFQPAIYLPHTQFAPMAGVQAVVRTSLPTDALTAEVGRVTAQFTGLDDQQVRTMRDRMAQTRTSPRFQALLVGAFALVSLLLAAVGLYGSLTHYVGRRRRELGLRMALGASRAGVLRMVMGQGMGLALAGFGVGMVATLASARAIDGFLFGVEPNDPATLAAVGAALVLVAALASLGPARRATAVDPITVLRSE
jgi:predicted permease